jgi:two-component system cell cycle sensor histidine kinase/response regulator CckA
MGAGSGKLMQNELPAGAPNLSSPSSANYFQLDTAAASSQVHFEKLLATIPAVVFTFRSHPDGTSCFPYASPRVRELFGLDPDELKASSAAAFKLVHPEDRQLLSASIAKSAYLLVPWGAEFRIFHPNGNEMWVEGYSAPKCEPDGSTTWFGLINDISARKRNEEQAERWKRIFESGEIGIAVSRASDDTYLEVNAAFARQHGYERHELIGKSILDISPPADKQKVLDSARSINEQGHFVFETIHRRKDGSCFPVCVEGTVIRDEAGRPHSRVIFVSDLTQKKELEAQFMQAQKMEAIGRLAGGVAHDFNNILGVIMSFSEIALRHAEHDHNLTEPLNEIMTAAQRAARLTRQLLAFSRQQDFFPKSVDLNSVIDRAVHMLTRIVGEDISIVVHQKPDLAFIQSDPGQIDQILMNLAVNARDAMPGGGNISIETSEAVIDENLAFRYQTPHRRFVVLHFSDTGCGMDETVKSRIFEPFFTTKEVGRGTGLGLSTVYGVVKQNGGYIEVSTQPGKGTKFSIHFPAASASSKPQDSSNSRSVSPTHKSSEVILLVEDESLLRMATAEQLKNSGYEVIEAESGQQALQLATDSKEHIDLLLTDFLMPEMNGTQLAEQLRSSRPGLKVLFVSGYDSEVINGHGFKYDATIFLEKPFTRAQLLTKVQHLLASKPGHK